MATVSIFVGNLPWATTEDDLRNLFAPYGEVHRARVVTDRETGRSRGFGFVDMNAEDAQRAIAELNGGVYGGRPLTVNISEQRPRSGPR